ncbi:MULTISPECIES: Hsp20 family protein [unclassified Modicisalibacter]|uniref:Hsp20 family protein n=1 Tax=unclassified Modicisalibacter TaxID=2679913 RepID=UPI001CCD2583|nr:MULTISPECIES: Hsp20 family protein [unclassified Modicisalibacter]MBZ9557095.1 Hsp20 family protein [Modicisalibacter sp. R2A 31.J]MBZ9574191.1 Hsp20 family protein [Modicisalibacter sp. MOD 31.J]
MSSAFSLEPLFRHSIGFDRFNDLFERAFDGNASTGFPPYNVEKHGDNDYRIVLAVAGFSEQDLDIQLEGGVLTVSGAKPQASQDDTKVRYMHQGIAQRSFKLTYRLEDHIEVQGAHLENGLLTIDLRREIPEAEKPRRIAIGSSESDGSGVRRLEEATTEPLEEPLRERASV